MKESGLDYSVVPSGLSKNLKFGFRCSQHNMARLYAKFLLVVGKLLGLDFSLVNVVLTYSVLYNWKPRFLRTLIIFSVDSLASIFIDFCDLNSRSFNC